MYEKPNFTQEEIKELLNHPHQIFDGDVRQTQEEARQVSEAINKLPEGRRTHNGVTVVIEAMPEGLQHKNGKKISIIWDDDKSGKWMLELTPTKLESDFNSKVISYATQYGRAIEDGNGTFSFNNDPISLAELFGIPEQFTSNFIPTITRWAITNPAQTNRTLYIGLGFLLSSQEGIIIGMHEGGHLPDRPRLPDNDENTAWDIALQHFSLLKQRIPFRLEQFERFMRYGLVSHFLVGNATIPDELRLKLPDIRQEFANTIKKAKEAFDAFFR